MESLEKIWPEWHIVKELGEGAFGKVYEIKREDIGGQYWAALKVIRIPKDKNEVKEIMAEGMDKESATQYFRGMVEELVREFAVMERMKGHTNVVAYEDHKVVPHEDGLGWDIYIRMELLTPLSEYVTGRSLEEQEVIKLGVDICKALELCQKNNIIHRDIKPENIFISQYGDFKLGDFGIARTAEKTMSGMSRKGTYTYMAPEVYKGEAYNASVDIYSLGIVLYRMLNDYRAPFLPQAPAPISFNDRETAQNRRLSGEEFPAPTHGGTELHNVIRKACAYVPHDRYASPTQMRKALEKIDVLDDEVEEVPVKAIPQTKPVSPIKEEEDKTVYLFANDEGEYKTVLVQPQSEQREVERPPISVTNESQRTTGDKRKQILVPWMRYGIGVLIVVAILIGVITIRNRDEKDRETGTAFVEQTESIEGKTNVEIEPNVVEPEISTGIEEMEISTSIVEVEQKDDYYASENISERLTEIENMNVTDAKWYVGNLDGKNSKLIIPDKILNAEKIYNSIEYIPEMFYGDYMLESYKYRYMETPDLSIYRGEMDYWDASNYGIEVSNKNGRMYTKIPYRIEAGPITFIEYPEIKNWMTLYVQSDLGEEEMVKGIYSISGRTLLFRPFINGRYEEGRFINDGLSDTCVEYEFSFKGSDLTLSLDGKSITLCATQMAIDAPWLISCRCKSRTESWCELDSIYIAQNQIDGEKFIIYLKDGTELKNAVGVFDENGLFTFSGTDMKGNVYSYQYVYIVCSHYGIVLMDGQRTYLFL